MYEEIGNHHLIHGKTFSSSPENDNVKVRRNFLEHIRLVMLAFSARNTMGSHLISCALPLETRVQTEVVAGEAGVWGSHPLGAEEGERLS